MGMGKRRRKSNRIKAMFNFGNFSMRYSVKSRKHEAELIVMIEIYIGEQ